MDMKESRIDLSILHDIEYSKKKGSLDLNRPPFK